MTMACAERFPPGDSENHPDGDRKEAGETPKGSKPNRQHFPPTQYSMIIRMITEEEREALNQHLMKAYREPLEIYYQGHKNKSLGDAGDVVAGFFSKRLQDHGFLRGWIDDPKKRQFRRWLMGAFNYYVNEALRDKARHDRMGELEGDFFGGDEKECERLLDRALLISWVRRALDQGKAQCQEQGLDKHWQAFELHNYQGLSYAKCAEELGLGEQESESHRVKTMAQAGKSRFVKALRELVANEKHEMATAKEIDDIIQSLLEASE